VTATTSPERPPWRRDLWIAAAGIAAFAGLLMLLPVPEPADPPGGPLPESNFAVVDVTVFDGEEFRSHRDVWVEDGRIRAVGQRLAMPDGLPRVDGRGHTLLPGLIDAHTHTYGLMLTDSLRFGVTTVLDQFTMPLLAAQKRPARERLARGDESDLFSAGNLATAPGGHGTQFGVPVATLTSPEEARDFVGARKEEGADWIKIVWEDGGAFGADIPTLDRATIAAVIEAAHAEGLLAVIHVSALEHGLAALAMGIDGFVHVWGDAVIAEADAARFADAGVFVIPALSVRVAAAGESMGPALLGETDPEHVSPMQRETLSESFPRPVGTPEAAVESVRRLHAAGVPILAGTDAPNPGTGFGISMHGELRLLQRAGLSAAEALAAATGEAVDAFGIEDRGRLERGRIADLLLVAGDLESDLTRSAAIAGVWKDGFPVEAAWAAPRQPE
jgi:imidazolonepropionase-like amidohydrolase